MEPAAKPGAPGTVQVFEKSCGYCGARFRVRVRPARFVRQLQEYACPECGKHYDTESGAQPEVELLIPRKDGKDDAYQDTMF